MPSPVGHAIAGLIVHVATANDQREHRHVARAWTAVGAAVAPDLDLLFKLFDGRNHHQGATHSLSAACAAGVVVWLWCLRRRLPRPASWGMVAGLAWASHVLLDYLGRDTSPPIGIPVLWPLDLRFHCPWSLFLDVGRTLNWATVAHDAVALIWEVALLLPILVLIRQWRTRRAA